MLKSLAVETINQCNAHCVFCAHSQLRNRGIMSDFLYDKIITEISHFPRPLDMFIASNIGEPFLDPHILERLFIARMKLPNRTEIHLYTNGSFLNNRILSALRELPYFALVVSINGTSKETRKRLTGLSDYDRVIKYTRKAIDMGINCIPSIVNYGVSSEEIEEFEKIWRSVPKRFVLRPLNFAGSVFKYEPKSYSEGICSRAVNYMTILWDGRVNLCCMDTPERIIFGDVNNNTIQEIWNSERRQKYIELHLRGESHQLKLCGGCNHPRQGW
jgi:radical SAM protein with 4Fe4S-binding SPASM domain